MDQEKIIQLLAKKMAGEITTAELRELEALLLRFPDALYYEEGLEQIWFTNPPARDVDAVYQKHLARHQAHFKQPAINIAQKTTYAYWLAAATILIICGLAGYLSIYNRQKATLPDTEVVCGKGMRKKITLPDGSSVWLNANSKLQYDQAMQHKDSRLVTLIGEAYFDIVKDKQHPFIIHTPKIAIKVLGTAFNVRAYPNEGLTEATLIRGSIDLSLNSNPQQHILLKPKEKFALNERAQKLGDGSADQNPSIHNKLVIEQVEPMVIANQQYFEETSWVQNKLVFKDETLAELLPRLQKWYNVSFKINNTAVGSYRFTGILENETITEALTAMQIVRPFKFKINANEVVIN